MKNWKNFVQLVKKFVKLACVLGSWWWKKFMRFHEVLYAFCPWNFIIFEIQNIGKFHEHFTRSKRTFSFRAKLCTSLVLLGFRMKFGTIENTQWVCISSIETMLRKKWGFLPLIINKTHERLRKPFWIAFNRLSSIFHRFFVARWSYVFPEDVFKFWPGTQTKHKGQIP